MLRIKTVTILLLLAGAPGFAQLTGRLTGTVVDPTGANVPNASVSLYLSGGKIAVLKTTTNPEGIFDFIAVRPEVYRLEVESRGFATYDENEVRVEPTRDLTLPPIKLSLTTSAQQIEVTAGAEVVDTASAEVSTTVTQAQIVNLPVLDRQINNLFVLQAGVAANGRANTAINGMRPSYSNLTLDGINFQDTVRVNDLDYIPNKITIAQVSEFTVTTTNASPTLGGGASTITLSTPSGTNQFHGAGYWYNRNGHLAANNWFSNQNGIARPPLHLNQIGGSVGGPILKDKLFFFANYEALRDHESSLRNNTILTPTARQGILQYKLNGNGPVQQFDVLKASGLAISPLMQSLLSQVPTAGNNPAIGDGLNTTGYSFNARSNETRDNVTGKVDFNLSPKHVFSGSYVWNRDIPDRPDLGPFYSFVPPVYNDIRGRLMSVAWRWTPTAVLTNELRGGFSLTPSTFVDTSKLPGSLISCTSVAACTTLFSSPIQTGEIGEGRRVNNYVLQDNANWVHGRHLVSFGYQMSQLRNPSFNDNGILPSYSIGISGASPYGFSSIPGASSTDVTRANSLLASLAGLLSQGTQTFNPTGRASGFVNGAPQVGNASFNTYALYALDKFKLRRDLTVTLGLRWDYLAPVDETDGLLLQPVVQNGNAPATLLGNATLDFAGSPVGRPLYKKDLNNFAPNVSLAWDVFGDGKTSVRSGFNVAFLNDNTLNTTLNATFFVNSGLTSMQTVGNLNARADSPPSIPVPPFQIPTTTLNNFKLSPSAPPAQGLMDPNLATPYAEQWNLSIEHEIKGFVVEGRYVGNHVVKGFRQIDFNQVNVFQGDFLKDFIRARNNGFAALSAGKGFTPAYNAAIPGSQPLTFLTTLPAEALTNATLLANLRSGEIGTMAQNLQSLGDFPGYPARTYLPASGFSYFPNQLALYSSLLTNTSNSTYDAAQVEVRKRIPNGMQFQANYTFSKALTNTFAQRGLEANLDNNNPGIEKGIANFNQTHAFKLNHFYPLPIGPGHRLHSGNPVLSRVIDGWGLSGFLALYSGNPVAILSARGTLNRGARSGLNTVDTPDSLGQLQALTGLFMTGNGPYWFNPANIGPDTHGVAADGSAPFQGQVFFNPQPGSLGGLMRRILTGPPYRSYDFAVSKSTRITERQSLELHADFYNLLNHPNFFINDQNVNLNNFGRITQQNTAVNGVGPRLIQFGLYYRF